MAEAVRRSASEAKTSFGSEVVFLERFVEKPDGASRLVSAVRSTG